MVSFTDTADKELSMAPGLIVRVSPQADEEILKLLSNTLLGSPGGLRYRLQGVPARIKAYPEIYFVSLLRGNKLLGTLALCRRKFMLGGEEIDAFYVRYLSIFAPLRSRKGRIRRRNRKIKPASAFENSIKDKIIELFLDPSLMHLPGLEKEGRAVFYAYVEPRNERSRRLVERAGYSPVRYFSTLPFSRFSPIADARIGKISEAEKAGFTETLRTFYSDHSFYFDEPSHVGDEYFVLRSEEDIIAGVRAILTEYLLEAMPGISGWVLLHISPHLPLLSRLFKNRRFRFLGFEALYCKHGMEDLIPTLLEGVCALTGHHNGILWLDSESGLYKKLHSNGNFGFLSKIFKEAPIGVYVNFYHPTESSVQYCTQHPAFISAFDSI